MSHPPNLDVITLGRASVDLYGQQIGCRLEDTASFVKAVGGCPANIAIGAARLGLRSALITRVGAEAMGGFIRERLAREGVCTTGIVTDSQRLTALVLLGVRDDRQFPLIFYRDRCADMALCAEDIDPAFLASAAALVVTGTHLSTATVLGASLKAIGAAKAAGARVIFDIDYRPNLWGLAGHDAGESRYIADAQVTEVLQSILGECDLIVGTEEEFRIAGGADSTHAALKAVRARSPATLVLKRGPMGCIVYPGTIPADLEQGVRGDGFPVEVYNVLGAGDAFMSGFLRGWLRDEPLETCCTWANACGAFAVSRLLCSPEIPTWTELCHFLQQGSSHKALRQDSALNHLHWATTRPPRPERLMALAIDHRAQFEDMADRQQVPRARIEGFKRLAVIAAAQVAAGRDGFGMLLDSTYGRTALFEAAGQNFWLARPVELPGSRPLRFEAGGDLGSYLLEWPAQQVVKCLCFYHPDDPEALKANQEERLLALRDACRRIGREMLIEIIASKHGPLEEDTLARVLTRLYDLDIKPDWWKLEPQTSPAAWTRIEAVLRARDPWCRGIVLLGLEAPEAELLSAFALAAPCPLVQGFAVGRTIFTAAAESWLAGKIDDQTAIADMAERFARLTTAWEQLTA